MVLRIKWYPNSFFQVRSDHHIVYIDPSKVEDMTLEKSDLILISHHHPDHVDHATVDRLCKEGTLVLGPSKVRSKVPKQLTEVKPGDVVPHGDMRVMVVDAYNPPKLLRPTFHKKGECVGFVVEIEGKRIYHAGDTGLIDEMNNLGKIDLALLPIGGTFTMDVEGAAEAVKRIKPTMVVPMHRLKADPQEFRSMVEAGKTAEVRILAPGEVLEIK